jgi:DeoR/GlpR family transcriptional regulator of sugar metabolism
MSKIQDRKVQVLKHIVEEYLKTGEIMGSKNLLKKYDLQVSSATVRNDMAALEDMGLIFQPEYLSRQNRRSVQNKSRIVSMMSSMDSCLV